MLSYRMRYDLTKTMHTSCFVTAAFGMIDLENSRVIFNGTDEAEALKIGGQSAAFSVIPYSSTIASFGGFPYSGSYMYLYTDILSKLVVGGSPLQGLYKEVNTLADFTVSDAAGQPLAVNSAAFAYSARGQWMVTESPNHALVRVNLATFSILPFDRSYFVQLNPFVTHGASMAITEDGRYAASAMTEFHTFKVYDLKTCKVKDSSDPLAPQDCQYNDYWDYVRAQVTGELKRISRVNFVGDGLISFQATFSNGTTESYLLSPTGEIGSLIPYLGLGDSYASGQGAFDYLSGTDTANNRCHLAAKSYPLLLNGDLFGNKGHSVACSGARIHDIGNTSGEYTGQTKDQRSAKQLEGDGSEVSLLHDFSPGYLAQQRFVTSYLPGVITVQIGGNDVGFGSVLLKCLSPIAKLRTPELNPNDCYKTYEDRLEIAEMINRTYSRWVKLYQQLKSQSPESRIYAIGYPHILSSKGACGLNVHLTLQEIGFARDMTNYLNGVIVKAARAAGVRYVDIADALKDHELCNGSAKDAVNGLTAGNDALGLLGQESFHPNAYGHKLIEHAILQATHNFSDAGPAANSDEPSPTTNDDDPLLQAPKTGRKTKIIVPVSPTTNTTTVRGGVITIRVTGASMGAQSNTSYDIRLGGASIGSLTSEGQGNIQGSVTVPIDINPGPNPIAVIGPNQTGGTVQAEDIIYVHDSSIDYDGDGVNNNIDSCPLVLNSGIDIDRDNVDDVCDQIVVPPASPPSQPSAAVQLGNETIAPSSTVSPATSTEAPLAILNDQTQKYSLSVATIFPAKVIGRSLSHSGISVGQPTRNVVLSIQGAKPAIVASLVPAVSPLPRFDWLVWSCALIVMLITGYAARLRRS